jgi:hypothetical protein
MQKTHILTRSRDKGYKLRVTASLIGLLADGSAAPLRNDSEAVIVLPA